MPTQSLTNNRRAAMRWCFAMLTVSVLAAWARPRPRRVSAQDQVRLEQLFPQRFGDWQMDAVSSALVRPAKEHAYQMYDQVLERTYINAAAQRVMLSVVFGSEQSSSLQLHRPEVCYRANGFEVRGITASMAQAVGRTWPVTRLVASMPDRPEPVTYWTILGGEVVQDAQSFRWRQWRFAAQREVMDGILVRVSSIETPSPAAFALHDAFIRQMVAAIAPAQRGKVIGTLSQSQP
jgi:EpsI family protein